MMRKLTLAAAVGVLALAGLVVGAPAQAAPGATDTSATVGFKVDKRQDTGYGTPNVWAEDSFTRNVAVSTRAVYQNEPSAEVKELLAAPPKTLCDVVADQDLVWQYTAVVTDTGTFTTTNDSATGSPGKGAPLAKGATGTFNGGARASIMAPAHWCTFKGDSYKGTMAGSAVGSTSEFLAKLFDKGEAKLTQWGWTYERCAGTPASEKWVNDAKSAKGNSGDITGKACPVPVPGNPAPGNPAPPAPTKSAEVLPVTGSTSPVPAIAGGGLALLVLGTIAVGLTRRKRIRTEA